MKEKRDLKHIFFSDCGKYCVVIISTFFFLLYFVKMAYRVGFGDDLNFVVKSSEYSLLEWVHTRYMTRSGRVVSEMFIWIFARIPEIYWKIITMIISILLSVYLYKWAILFGNKKSFFLALFCALAPYMMNFGTFVDGTLWVTGSFNYLYIAVPGIIGMYYIVGEVFQKVSVGVSKKILATVLIMITVSSSEQMGAVIIALLFFFNLWKIRNSNCSVYSILLMGSNIILYAITVFLAPGVRIRKAGSIQKRIPDFLTAPLGLRAEYSIRWIMDALVNHMGLLFNMVWIILIIILISERRKCMSDKCIILILFVAEIISFLDNKCAIMFEFEAEWGLQKFSKISYLAMGFWGLIFIVTLLGIYKAGASTKIKYSSVLLLLAVFGCTFIMIFSPTMYASGCRVMYHGSLIMIVLILLLISQLRDRVKFYKLNISNLDIALAVMLVCEGYYYLRLYEIVSAGFKVHLPW